MRRHVLVAVRLLSYGCRGPSGALAEYRGVASRVATWKIGHSIANTFSNGCRQALHGSRCWHSRAADRKSTGHYEQYYLKLALRTFTTSCLSPFWWHKLSPGRPYPQAAWQFLKRGQGLLPSVWLSWPVFPWHRLYWFVSQSSKSVQIAVLNSIHLAGMNLPRTLGFLFAEALQNFPLLRGAGAEGFDCTLEVPQTPDKFLPGSWWGQVLGELQEAISNVMRVVWLMILFAPVAITAPLALYLDIKRLEWMELLRKTLEAAGPAFIKWGQWAATRHDLFPPDFCLELEQLHTQAPVHRFRHTQQAVEEAFGLSVSDLFLVLDKEPVASGSIGQIHRAVLSQMGAIMTGCDAGTVVAVKVRHPGVGYAIARDFSVMMWLAQVASWVPALKHLRLEDTMKQFAAPLREQVDLSREAQNLIRFNENFRKTSAVRFPLPLYPLVSQDVLVESYEVGRHITEYISQETPYSSRLAALGSGTMLQMMLVDNLIHSDLHPGNILVTLERPRGLLGLAYRACGRLKHWQRLKPSVRRQLDRLQSAWLDPCIILLDVGMATELTLEDQRNMLGLFRAFAELDGKEAGRWVLRFSGAQQTCPDPEVFTSGMADAFRKIREQQEEKWSGKTIHYNSGADALNSVLELVRQHQVNLPGHICAVVVTTLVLEGWSNKLDPDHSVLQQVQGMFEPVAHKWHDRICHVVDQVMDNEEYHWVMV